MVCKCFYERVTTYPFRRVQSKEPCLNRGWRSRQPLHVALFHEDIITLVQHERFFTTTMSSCTNVHKGIRIAF